MQVVEQIFNLYARLSGEAAAAGDDALARSLTEGMGRLAAWWDPFATVEVSEVRRVHGGEAAASARQVAAALAGWRQRGEAAADLAFWRGQLDHFRSPKAFALVVDALLGKGDFRSALALLASWLGQAEQVAAGRRRLLVPRPRPALDAGPHPAGRRRAGAACRPAAERRALVVKFFDYLEANAEDYWEVPALDLAEAGEDEEEEEEDLYGAAYEDVTYQDTTDDSEGDVSDGGEPTDEFDLEREGERLERRLRFLTTLARLWQVAARFLAPSERARPRPAIRRCCGLAAHGPRQAAEDADAARRRPRPAAAGADAAPTIPWWNTTAAASSRNSCSTRPSAPAST